MLTVQGTGVAPKIFHSLPPCCLCRVLVYNPREILAARRVQELVTNLHYPNGLQLSPDESFLLIGEGGRSRIFR